MFSKDAEGKRNKPAVIIITAVAFLVVISAGTTFFKIGSELNDMNTYSGAAVQARQALNSLEKVSFNGIDESTVDTAREAAESLRRQINALEQDTYGLNHNKLISSDVNAHNIYTVIEIRTKDFVAACNSLITNLENMAVSASYELDIPDKEILKNRLGDLTTYLEQRSLE
jgi:hypothetical protein